MSELEYLNEKETIALKRLDSKQHCIFSGEEIPSGEFAVGFDFNGYESRTPWVAFESVIDFSGAVTEAYKTDGSSIDGTTGILMCRSNSNLECDVCGEAIEEYEFMTIENDDPRYAMNLHKTEDCIDQFQKDLRNLKSKMHLIMPEKI